MNEKIGGLDQNSYLLLALWIPAGGIWGSTITWWRGHHYEPLVNLGSWTLLNLFQPKCSFEYVVVTYTWPLYQGTSAEEFMLGRDNQVFVRATLPYCSQRDAASSLARLVPLVTSGRLILDSKGRVESVEWVPQPQVNTGLAEYSLIPWLGEGLVAFVSAESGRRTECCDRSPSIL